MPPAKIIKNNDVRNYKLTLSSKTPFPMPAAAPDPANPTKCPEPMLLANKDAPTC